MQVSTAAAPISIAVALTATSITGTSASSWVLENWACITTLPRRTPCLLEATGLTKAGLVVPDTIKLVVDCLIWVWLRTTAAITSHAPMAIKARAIRECVLLAIFRILTNKSQHSGCSALRLGSVFFCSVNSVGPVANSTLTRFVTLPEGYRT